MPDFDGSRPNLYQPTPWGCLLVVALFILLLYVYG